MHSNSSPAPLFLLLLALKPDIQHICILCNPGRQLSRSSPCFGSSQLRIPTSICKQHSFKYDAE